ncbi:MAG: acyltransferase family protein [Cyclobacteriaceae bacterium]|nr:acyltransferase family protein [Cyclobacteriaceae bacterium]
MTSNRRYDLDWVRVIAIGLLLLYHVAIGFQSWGVMIGFITTKKPWASLWIPMTMLNVWRIPLLFFVSGMGVYFALQNRNCKQLLQERATRILLPLLFGVVAIVPITTLLWRYYYKMELSYNYFIYNPGHLWFLGNIFVYVVVFTPLFFYLKRNEDGKLVTWIRKMFSTPLGLLPVLAAFVVEVVLVDPMPYELYAMTWHGFFLGLLAFFFGFCFVLSGDAFWKMIVQWRWMFLAIAVALYTYRFLQFQMRVPGYALAIESNFWILSVFAFAPRYLNRPSKALTYLSKAAYPVYILHMIFLSLGSILIFQLDIPVPLQFILVLLFTGLGCLAVYEFIIRRINIIRPLFGVKMKDSTKTITRESSSVLKSS